MPEDEIAQNEIAALTRRTEEELKSIHATLRLHGLAIAGLDAKIDEGFEAVNERLGRIEVLLASLAKK